MKVLVLYAHPVESSFNAGLDRTIVERLSAAGHAIDDCDLYAEDFDPRMTRAERLGYHAQRGPNDAVAGYVERLRKAEALVLSFPVWNYGYPAILKGFFDRVFAPGVAFRHDKDGGRIIPLLTNIRHFWVLTTTGSPWWVEWTTMRSPT